MISFFISIVIGLYKKPKKDIKAKSDLVKFHSFFLIFKAVHKHSQEAGNPQLRLSMFTIYHFDP